MNSSGNFKTVCGFVINQCGINFCRSAEGLVIVFHTAVETFLGPAMLVPEDTPARGQLSQTDMSVALRYSRSRSMYNVNEP